MPDRVGHVDLSSRFLEIIQLKSRKVENAPIGPIFGVKARYRGGFPYFRNILRNFGFSGERGPAGRPDGASGFVFNVLANPSRIAGLENVQSIPIFGVRARFRYLLRKGAGRPAGWALWIFLQAARNILSESRKVENAPIAPTCGVRARFRRNFRRFGEFFEISVFSEKEGRMPGRLGAVDVVRGGTTFRMGRVLSGAKFGQH